MSSAVAMETTPQSVAINLPSSPSPLLALQPQQQQQQQQEAQQQHPNPCSSSKGMEFLIPSSPLPSSSSSPSTDPLYERLRSEAYQAIHTEPAITCLFHRTILSPAVQTFEEAVASTISYRLGSSCGPSPVICSDQLYHILREAFASQERVLGWTMSEAVRDDVLACVERDPACTTILEAILFYKGFASLVLHRAARRSWTKGSKFVAMWLQSQASAAFGVDIHPAASVGKGVMLDHATGIVIGETASVGDGCSLLHGVTLGGTGKDAGDRHPKVGKDVLIGAGASILGNINIGDGAKIGAGSVVLRPVPHGATAVGAPAKIIGRAKEQKPGTENDTVMKSVLPVLHHTHDGSGISGRRGRSKHHSSLRRTRSRSFGEVMEIKRDLEQDEKKKEVKKGDVPTKLTRSRSSSVSRENVVAVMAAEAPSMKMEVKEELKEDVTSTAVEDDNKMSVETTRSPEQDKIAQEEEKEEEEVKKSEAVKEEKLPITEKKVKIKESEDVLLKDKENTKEYDDEEKKEVSDNDDSDTSSGSSSSGTERPRGITRNHCLDSELCIWRNFGGIPAPPGAIDLYMLRRLLLKEGCTDAEIGEVFFELLDDVPYIKKEDLRRNFPDVMQRYTKLDHTKVNLVMECLLAMAMAGKTCNNHNKQQQQQQGNIVKYLTTRSKQKGTEKNDSSGKPNVEHAMMVVAQMIST